MGHGAWGMGHGAWGMGHGAWGMGHGAWGMGHGAWDSCQLSVVSWQFHFLVGAAPVAALIFETLIPSSVEGVGTGALPLQKPVFDENETALGSGGLPDAPMPDARCPMPDARCPMP